jgi:hypothetical protein
LDFDGEAQVGDGIEIQVLKRADGSDQSAQYREVLQLGRNPEFDRPAAA